MSLTEQLRDAIESSGLTLYRIAKDAGIPYAVLHRFATSERQVRLDQADKLAAYFSMRLTRPVKPKGRKEQ